MGKRLQWITQGIVPRLRITFCVIAAILVTQLTVGFALVRSLNQSIDDLTLSAFNVFLITEVSERELKNLLLLLQQVNSATSAADLAPSKRQLTTNLQKLERTIDRMAAADVPTTTSARMAEALESIEQSVFKISDTKESILLLDAKIQDFEATLLTLRQDTHRIVEGLSFEATKRTDDAIRATTAETNVSPTRLNEQISDSLALANTLTTITLQLEAIMIKAIGFKNLSRINELQTRDQNLRFEIRSVVILISQLAPSPARTELARALADLRETLFAQDGLTSTIFARNELEQALNVLLSAQRAPMTSISTLSEQLNTDAKAQVASARLYLAQTTQRLTLIAALTTLISVVAIGAANMFVLERQINRRVVRLTRAVVSIADGQTSYDVDIHGEDELGKIANALETFKINARELSRSNAELEKFAYAAAHDLRSPLRAIQDLVQWTLEDDTNQFSEDGQQNMTLLQNRIDRLNSLLSDLLEYSRVGQEAKDISTLRIKDLVRDISDLVDPDNHFDIKYIGDDQPIQTYATPLRQILLNLISNGVKHHDRPSGHISVDATIKDARIFVRVTEDGPGIPQKYQERVFGLFETLKSRDEVEGSGLGLSIIRKSVENYDGTITVQSDPKVERGTTFLFDLPETSAVQVNYPLAA